MSYSTVEEATAYIQEHYISTDDLRKNWESLGEEDQQALLNRSQAIIDNLPLRGRKTELGQPNQFPRNGKKEVPDVVKQAEAELALAYTDSSAVDDAQHYRKLVQYGISSYSIGNFSESLLTYGKHSLQVTYGLISVEAERLLSPWLYGGFCIE